jgi:hypothetical protein
VRDGAQESAALRPRPFGGLLPDRPAHGDAAGPGARRHGHLTQEPFEVRPAAEQHPRHARGRRQFAAGDQPGPFVGLVGDIQGELRLEHIHARDGGQASGGLHHHVATLRRSQARLLRAQRVGERLQEEREIGLAAGLSHLPHQRLGLRRGWRVGVVVDQQFDGAGPDAPGARRVPSRQEQALAGDRVAAVAGALQRHHQAGRAGEHAGGDGLLRAVLRVEQHGGGGRRQGGDGLSLERHQRPVGNRRGVLWVQRPPQVLAVVERQDGEDPFRRGALLQAAPLAHADPSV